MPRARPELPPACGAPLAAFLLEWFSQAASALIEDRATREMQSMKIACSGRGDRRRRGRVAACCTTSPSSAGRTWCCWNATSSPAAPPGTRPAACIRSTAIPTSPSCRNTRSSCTRRSKRSPASPAACTCPAAYVLAGTPERMDWLHMAVARGTLSRPRRAKWSASTRRRGACRCIDEIALPRRDVRSVRGPSRSRPAPPTPMRARPPSRARRSTARPRWRN